jgi:DNA polymerase
MELYALTKSIEEYFRHQRELFGSVVFIEKSEYIPIDFSKDERTASAPVAGSVREEIPATASPALPLAITSKEHVIESDEHKKTILPEIISDNMNDKQYEQLPAEWKNAETLEELNSAICNCHQCVLGDTRKNFVFGKGNPHADIVVIGEAPGADEDEQGAPFVGRAGQLLTKILESVNFTRDEVFICNIIKCRPPENRKPLVPEVTACEPFLRRQLEIIKPRFILALGLTAVDTLLKKKHAMAETRGSLMDYHGFQMLVTYHPAALLRNPEWKKATWEDIKMLRRMYDEYKSSGK